MGMKILNPDRMPPLIRRLVELCAAEEAVVGDLCQAVVAGKREEILNSAKRLAALRATSFTNSEDCTVKIG
jgi:hypothetical protein